MLVHHCATKGGHQLNLVVYGPRQALEALSDSAWNQLAVAAAADGGLVPGSGRTRVEDMYVHFVYQTVRSTSPANKIHREFAVQGRGATEDEASKAATEATEKVKAHLSYIGETPVEVGPKRHVPVIQGEHGIVIEECVYRATTVGNWTVIATDFGTSKPEACAAARAVANTIANNYGGAASGTEIEPHEQP
jgi:hypothetical protein